MVYIRKCFFIFLIWKSFCKNPNCHFFKYLNGYLAGETRAENFRIVDINFVNLQIKLNYSLIFKNVSKIQPIRVSFA